MVVPFQSTDDSWTQFPIHCEKSLGDACTELENMSPFRLWTIGTTPAPGSGGAAADTNQQWHILRHAGWAPQPVPAWRLNHPSRRTTQNAYVDVANTPDLDPSP